MFERTTDPARQVGVAAQEEARAHNHPYIGPEHLLLALIRDRRCRAAFVLRAVGVSLDRLRDQIDKVIGMGVQKPTGHIPFSPASRKVYELALHEALRFHHNHIGTEHLLLGVMQEGENAGAVMLRQFGAELEALRRQVPNVSQQVSEGLTEADAGSVLQRLGSFLSESSRPLHREKEIEQLVRVLTRRKRRNPILVGESGVGKSTIIDGLAQSILANQVPPSLAGHRIFAVNQARLLENVQDRTELDSRLNELLAALRADKVILFFDDVQRLSRITVLGAQVGDALGHFIAAERLVITATTPARFRQLLEQDMVVEGDCQVIDISEPAAEQAVEMLKHVRERIEAHYRLGITDDGIAAAVAMARRHRPDRALPGAAIDIVDDTAAMLTVEQTLPRPDLPPDLGNHNASIAKMRRHKEAAIDAQEVDAARQFQEAENRLLESRQEWVRRWQAGDIEMLYEVDEGAVAKMLGVDLPAEEAPQRLNVPTTSAVQTPDRNRSTAVLVGAGSFTDTRLPALPAVPRNLRDLRRALTSDNGMFNASRVHVFDRVSHTDLTAISRLTRTTDDTLLIYYTGHGLNENDDLYLAYADTDRDEPQLTGLPYQHLRYLVGASPARRCIVILDCCYSGKVIEWMNSGDQTPTGELDIRGTYVLTATGTSQKAIAPVGERHTAFTGALLRLLAQGLDNAGEFLHVADIYPRLAAELRSRRLPEPRQRPVDSISSLAIARNPAWNGPA
ncbi:Clp protease N-terminal domain-containing protein [Actinoplanes sp. NPDC051513]|uniref:caspase, EACC1-associated type n=1 Tax=Actinoplanes sp. NPDC051513 TaxID=3363908 RepID=UPI0037B7E6FC